MAAIPKMEWDGENFVLTGRPAYIVTSPDGVNWTEVPSNPFWEAVAPREAPFYATRAAEISTARTRALEA